MAKDRYAVTCNGRAAFYAAMWDDIRQCAMNIGWAVALHGSLSSDMDIMAMPWVEQACPFETLVTEIAALFKGNSLAEKQCITYEQKPNGRLAASISIWADFFLDISTIEPELKRGRWIPVEERLPDNSEHDWVLAQVIEDNGFAHIPSVMEYRQNRNDWHSDSYGWISDHNGSFRVTHWMPLPNPPKEVDDAPD